MCHGMKAGDVFVTGNGKLHVNENGDVDGTGDVFANGNEMEREI